MLENRTGQAVGTAEISCQDFSLDRICIQSGLLQPQRAVVKPPIHSFMVRVRVRVNPLAASAERLSGAGGLRYFQNTMFCFRPIVSNPLQT